MYLGIGIDYLPSGKRMHLAAISDERAERFAEDASAFGYERIRRSGSGTFVLDST